MPTHQPGYTRKVLLGAAYLYLYCGFSSVSQAQKNRTQRPLTIHVALEEHGEGAIGNCLPLCAQNQETIHRPGCPRRAWGRCCRELPTSMFTVGSALWARYTELRNYSPSRSRRMEECAVGNCPPLSLLWVQLCGPGTQNQETTHRPGCSEGAGGRCCWELLTSTFPSTFTVGSALWARYTEPRDYSLSRLLWNMGKMLFGAAYLYAPRTKRLLTIQVALEQHGEDAVGSHLVQHATQELAGNADAVAWDDHVAGKMTHFVCK